jgi:tetratricopeptide (TPR) repeat protein
LFKRALAIGENALRKISNDEITRLDERLRSVLAQSLNGLAEVYRTLGEYADAEPLYRRGLAVEAKAFGSEHPNAAKILKNYATLLRETGRDAEAAKLEARARAIRANYAKACLPN